MTDDHSKKDNPDLVDRLDVKEMQGMARAVMALGDVPYILKLKEGADIEAMLKELESGTFSPKPPEIHYVPSEEHPPGYIHGHATMIIAELRFDCEFRIAGTGKNRYWTPVGEPQVPFKYRDSVESVIILTGEN